MRLEDSARSAPASRPLPPECATRVPGRCGSATGVRCPRRRRPSGVRDPTDCRQSRRRTHVGEPRSDAARRPPPPDRAQELRRRGLHPRRRLALPAPDRREDPARRDDPRNGERDVVAAPHRGGLPLERQRHTRRGADRRAAQPLRRSTAVHTPALGDPDLARHTYVAARAGCGSSGPRARCCGTRARERSRTLRDAVLLRDLASPRSD